MYLHYPCHHQQPAAARDAQQQHNTITSTGCVYLSACCPSSCAGLMFLFTSCSTCHARSTRSLAANQKAAAVKQAPGVVVSFKEVKPTLSRMWIPSIKSDQASVQVPVAGSAGTPSTADTMSRIRYTGRFTCTWLLPQPVLPPTWEQHVAAAPDVSSSKLSMRGAACDSASPVWQTHPHMTGWHTSQHNTKLAAAPSGAGRIAEGQLERLPPP